MKHEGSELLKNGSFEEGNAGSYLGGKLWANRELIAQASTLQADGLLRCHAKDLLVSSQSLSNRVGAIDYVCATERTAKSATFVLQLHWKVKDNKDIDAPTSGRVTRVRRGAGGSPA